MYKKSEIERLVNEFYVKVYNLCYRMLNDLELAKDATQEVFLRMLKSIKSFRHKSSFSTWLYRITTNTAIDYLRKFKRNNTVSLDEEIIFNDETGEAIFLQVPENNPSILEQLEKHEMKEIIHKALNMLPERHRIILILRYWEGLSYDEIAEVLNIPEGTVGSRLHNATVELAKILKSIISKEVI